MTFRKSLTTLAAVALIAFAVGIAQADNSGTCPGKAQAGGSGQREMKGAACGQGQMNAAGCSAACMQKGMSRAACQGQMQGGDCCKGKMPADCCKGKMMGGGAAGCEMHGDKCNMDCTKMMQQGCGAMGGGACSMDNDGCKWSCNGIWGDYDCSNPGGRSLLNCGSRNSCRMMIMCGDDNDENCMMMMRKMGGGRGGMKMMRRMNRGEGGMNMMRMDGGCCAGGPKMERKVIMMHKHDGSCKPGCMGMGQGDAGSMPSCGTTPPPQMQHEGCPHTGK